MLLPADRQRYWFALSLVLLVAFALRLAVLLVEWDVHHSDEVFQVLEPAHRLVFGTGIVAWEMEYGVRSWILPGFVAGIMALVRPFSEQPDSYLLCVQLACIALSLIAPACAFEFGYRRFGLRGAVLTAAVPASWVDLIYFSSHSLSEPLGAHFWLAGLLLASAPGSRRWPGVAGGALLALSLLIRLQLAPAVALALAWMWWTRPERRASLLLGVACVVLGGGLLDTLTWGLPWQSIWRYLLINLYYGVNEAFGVSPLYWYPGLLVYYLGAGAIVFAALFLLGARDSLLIVIAVVALLIAHSMIGHKEYRFIYPAIEFAAVPAGLGLARLVLLLTDRAGRAWPAVAAIAGVMLVSLATAASPGYEQNVRQNTVPFRDVARLVRELPGLCGVGLKAFWSYTGGYTFIHRPVPLFDVSTPPLWPRYQAGFNAVIYEAADKPEPGAGYTEVGCVRTMCVAARSGGCAAVPAWTNDWRPRPIRDLAP